MIKISKIVEQILLESDFAYFAMQDKILNLSAFANTIKPEVARRAKKPIKDVGSITMSLSRLQTKISKNKTKKIPSPTQITIKKNLSELLFSKTPEILHKIKKLQSNQDVSVNFGVSEILILTDQNRASTLLRTINAQPLGIIEDLCAITLTFDKSDALTPNIFYGILGKLAVYKISIIEILTTYTEITLVIEQKNLSTAYSILQNL